MAAAAPGHHRVHRLGRGDVVVGLQRLRYPVALDPELGKEFLTLARRGVPAAHALTLSPCGRHTTCTECAFHSHDRSPPNLGQRSTAGPAWEWFLPRWRRSTPAAGH